MEVERGTILPPTAQLPAAGVPTAGSPSPAGGPTEAVPVLAVAMGEDSLSFSSLSSDTTLSHCSQSQLTAALAQIEQLEKQLEGLKQTPGGGSGTQGRMRGGGPARP
eukprot:1259962-Rhodomonas_salina.1